MTTLSYSNGFIQSRTYDQALRLTSILEMNGSVLRDVSYLYDAADNITQITDQETSERTQVFGYDELNRLTEAAGVYGTLAYTYDANGNRTTDTVDGGVKSYDYASAGHHLLQTRNGGTVTYSYDANGNTVDNTDHQFAYGDNNRLKQASVDGIPVADYTYNGRGERVRKTAGGAVSYYYYDQAGQLITEADGTGAITREYVYLDGQPIALIEGTAIYSIHTDHLGTPQVITDPDQSLAWEAEYDPFGQATVTTEFITNNLRFPGQYFDQETGLHYNYFRDYDPSIGRYIESDPIGLDGGVNTYTYVSSNPVVDVDPLGLIIWEGKVQIHDVGYIGGFSLLTAELTSQCINGEEYTVFVKGVFGGANIGLVPAGSTESNETLDDGLSHVDPNVFNGFAYLGVGSITIGRGKSISYLNLGVAETPKTKNMQPRISDTTGVGEGLLYMAGYSWIVEAPIITSCGCR